MIRYGTTFEPINGLILFGFNYSLIQENFLILKKNLFKKNSLPSLISNNDFNLIIPPIELNNNFSKNENLKIKNNKVKRIIISK